jgi:hypothetical protein
MNRRAYTGLVSCLSVVSMSLLLTVNHGDISINSAAAYPHQPESGTLEYLCLKYKDKLQVTENDCNEMFYNNDVKADLGWVSACRIAKLAANQFPTLIRMSLGFTKCHAGPLDQVNSFFDNVKGIGHDAIAFAESWQKK